MQTSSTKQNFSCDDPLWVLLAELSLGDFLSDADLRDNPTAGYLFQTLQELGMSAECMENIARTLAGFAKEASMRIQREWLEFPGRIRIFCQKKLIDDAIIVKPRRPYHTEQGKKPKRILPDYGANTIGGWGHFIIERGEDLPPYSAGRPHNCIDLYLYTEGE
jgi:hypothetical protein